MKINEKEMEFVTFSKAVRREERYSEKTVISFVSYPQLFLPTDILVDRYVDKMKIYIPLCKMLSRFDDIYKFYHDSFDDESRFYYYHDADVHLRYCYKQLELMSNLYVITGDAYGRIYR